MMTNIHIWEFRCIKCELFLISMKYKSHFCDLCSLAGKPALICLLVQLQGDHSYNSCILSSWVLAFRAFHTCTLRIIKKDRHFMDIFVVIPLSLTKTTEGVCSLRKGYWGHSEYTFYISRYTNVRCPSLFFTRAATRRRLW